MLNSNIQFIEHIPKTYYYNFKNKNDIEQYIYPLDNSLNNKKQIKRGILKPNYSYGGNGIKIIENIKEIDYKLKNVIVSEYIEHSEYYAGHFLVIDGIIQDKIYFCSNYKYKNNIKCGRIKNYTIQNKLIVDDNIFDLIFTDLSYSGFADSDFIIHNNKIIIFEINPRPGGSLIHDKIYLNKFINSLYEHETVKTILNKIKLQYDMKLNFKKTNKDIKLKILK